MRKSFRLNKRNAMLLGVCSGISDYTGWDVALIRIGAVVVTIVGAFPWTVIGYVVTAWMAKPAEEKAFGPHSSAPPFQPASRASTQESTRRVEDIDTYVANPNEKLAREIEELR
jgi:phage shock protein C